MASATTSFALPDGSAAHRDPLRNVRSFLLTQCGLHQVQVIAGRLIIASRSPSAPLCSASSRAISTCCTAQPPVADAKCVARDEIPGFVEMDTALVGVTHVVRRHVLVASLIRCLNRSRSDWVTRMLPASCGFRAAPLPCPGTLSDAAVFRQQVVAQRARNGAGDPPYSEASIRR